MVNDHSNNNNNKIYKTHICLVLNFYVIANVICLIFY